MAQTLHSSFIATVSMLCATRIELIIFKGFGKNLRGESAKDLGFQNSFLRTFGTS